MNLPDVHDPDWNERRIRFEQAALTAAKDLLEFAGAAQITLRSDDGTMTVTINRATCPAPH